MPTIAPNLTLAYQAVTQPSPVLLARVTAGVAVVAHAVLTEYASTTTDVQRAWARSALAFPLRDVKPALWVVTNSFPYRRDGDAIADSDILAALMAHLDVLSASTAAPSA